LLETLVPHIGIKRHREAEDTGIIPNESNSVIRSFEPEQLMIAENESDTT
jgi:hypothetical protein